MKKIFLVFGLMLVTSFIYSQGLTTNASYIKATHSDDYEATLKKHALEEWQDDYTMVVYEINLQADALVELIDTFKSENTKIVYSAIKEWSIHGYENSNINKFGEIKTFGLSQLLKLHCDWTMVKYEYDNQVKAKNSF